MHLVGLSHIYTARCMVLKKNCNLFSLIVLFAIADLTENVQVLQNVLLTRADMYGSQGRACNVVDFWWCDFNRYPQSLAVTSAILKFLM